jgi:thymidylate synthase
MQDTPIVNEFDAQYKTLLTNILTHGSIQQNRTNVATKWLPSAMVQVDLQKGFPVLTLRKIYPMAAMAEMQGFLRGYNNSQDFADLGCKYWHANANEPTKGSKTPPWLSSPHRLGENDLGEIYGVLWRNWETDEGNKIDQIRNLIHDIQYNPQSRRMIVSGWKPDSVIGVRGALPPCHVLWKVMLNTTTREMHLSWYQRSCDVVLGLPSNVVEYAFLLELLARVTGYTPRLLTGHIDDVHVYEDHLDAARLMLERDAFCPPVLEFQNGVPKHDTHSNIVPEHLLTNINNSHLLIKGYNHHHAIDGLKMTV